MAGMWKLSSQQHQAENGKGARTKLLKLHPRHVSMLILYSPDKGEHTGEMLNYGLAVQLLRQTEDTAHTRLPKALKTHTVFRVSCQAVTAVP